MTPQIQQGIQRARAAGIPEEEIQKRVQYLQSQQPQTPPPQVQEDKSLGGFVSNVGSDIATNVKGIMALPQVAMQAVQNPIKTGETVAKGIVDEYVELASDPLGTAYNKPVTTLLNVLPFAQAGKAAMVGKVGKAADVVSDAAKIGKTIDATQDVSKVANLADEMTISKILQDVGGVDQKQVGQLSRNLYQQSLSFSKKSNAFERYRPNETAAKMIDYGIAGSSDDIAKTASKVSGSNGILSRVVNEAVGSTQKPVDVSRVYTYMQNIEPGVYSALSPEKINDVLNRVRRLPQKELGTVDASMLLDFERKLQSEGFAHHIAGLKGDTAAQELANLKLGLADEIGSLIDDAVRETQNLEKFNDPRVISELNQISPKLAQEYQAAIQAGDISAIRSLQSPFVRIQKIIDLSQNEASSLGTNFFRTLSNIPGVGEVLNALSNQISTPLATTLAVGLEKNMIGQGIKKAGSEIIKGKPAKVGAATGAVTGFMTGGLPGAVVGAVGGGLTGRFASNANRVSGATMIGRQQDNQTQPLPDNPIDAIPYTDSSFNGQQETQQQTQEEPLTGYTVEEYLSALSKATAANNQEAVREIKQQLAIQQEADKLQPKQNKLTEKQNQYKAAADGATYALQLLESGRASTGIGTNFAGGIKRATGMYTPEQQDFLSTLSTAKGFLLNALSGANVPPQEYNRLKSLLEIEGSDPEIAKQQLRTFIREAGRFYNAETSPLMFQDGTPAMYGQ